MAGRQRQDESNTRWRSGAEGMVAARALGGRRCGPRGGRGGRGGGGDAAWWRRAAGGVAREGGGCSGRLVSRPIGGEQYCMAAVGCRSLSRLVWGCSRCRLSACAKNTGRRDRQCAMPKSRNLIANERRWLAQLEAAKLQSSLNLRGRR